MPCTSYDPDEVTTTRQSLKRLHNCEAMLCAIVRKYGFSVASAAIDKECGVSLAWFQAWWERHKAKDMHRQEQEKQKNHEAKVKKNALSKLTAEELKILGIKKND